MVGAHQNLNGSRDLTICPFQGWFAIRELALATVNYLSNLKYLTTHYENIKSDTKYRKWDGLGSYMVTRSRSLEIAQIDRPRGYYEFLLAFDGKVPFLKYSEKIAV